MKQKSSGESRPRKYRIGPVIRSVEVLTTMLEDNRYVMYHDRPMHHGWLRCMQFWVVVKALKTGYLKEAIPVGGQSSEPFEGRRKITVL